MASFGATSRRRLATLDPRLQKVLEAAIEVCDFTILCGHRDRQAQNAAYRDGKSTLLWPDSKHNTYPSIAVDVAPWSGTVDWDDEAAFGYVAGVIKAMAHLEGVELRWGGDWNDDMSTQDHDLRDLPHLEIRDA